MSSLAESLPYGISDDLEFEYEDRRKEQLDLLDYKMVTFTLGGKDFGIDIMKVKEISKATRFTYVPNAAPFVRGVYNLRGDIISIIDLRVMFNIPIEKAPQAAAEKKGRESLKHGENLEQMIILRLEDNTLGVIVDSIDKVVSIASKNIQPPHPIFGDINIQFISGIVENENRLYIILDVERIFSQKKAQEAVPAAAAAPVLHREAVKAAPQARQDLDFTFISENLASLRQFFVSPVNEAWVRKRLADWKTIRKRTGDDVQLNDSAEADSFLTGFYSMHTAEFWNPDYRNAVKALLPGTSSNVVNVWNPGCGAGRETYSLACILREKYPGKRIKIWAHDKNLIDISTAPTLVVQKGQIPSCYDPYLTETGNGFQFSTEIKEMILFEYHDIVHNNHLPPMDVVVARDVFSFLATEEQTRLMEEIEEILKPKGLLVLGQNENLTSPEWKPAAQGGVTGFIKQ